MLVGPSPPAAAGSAAGARPTPAHPRCGGKSKGHGECDSACSYFSGSEVQENMAIFAVNVLAVNRPLSLYIVSKSVFCTRNSVKKYLLRVISPLSVLFEVSSKRVRSSAAAFQINSSIPDADAGILSVRRPARHASTQLFLTLIGLSLNVQQRHADFFSPTVMQKTWAIRRGSRATGNAHVCT